MLAEEAINGNGLDRNQSVDVPVRVTPTGLGERSYRIRLFTNDPLTPEHVVGLSVNTETLGRCSMRVEPEGDLQLVPQASGRSLGTVSFINLGNTRCVVDDPHLSSGASPEFSIIDPAPQLIVPPGATRTMTIEGPRSVFPVLGSFSFHVLNPGSERQFIVLHVPP